MAEIEETLSRLELALQSASVRSSAEQLDALIAEDFREFGSSGRIYDKADVISAMLDAKPNDPAEMQDFSVNALSDNIVLVTYTSVRPSSVGPMKTRRSSLWRLSGGNWQMVFHQGTPLPLA